MTHMDIDTFSVYPEVIRKDVNCWSLTPGGATLARTSRKRVIRHRHREGAGVDQPKLITTGGDTFGGRARAVERRQQRADRCAPTWVVGYERNTYTNNEK